MKRGRIFIYLALIVIIAVGAGGGYLWLHRKPATTQPPVTQVTPEPQFVEIVTAGQNIAPGTPITEAMLSSIQYPETALVQGLFTNKADVVNMYAKYAIDQGVPIMDSMISEMPGANLPGSSWAPFIPQGLTAVAIPITRLSSVAYGIRDGDYVDIIVTMLLVDVDPTNQTILPNFDVTISVPTSLDASITDGLIDSIHLSGTSDQPSYLVSSEGQRPRLVTQMIAQNVQVLHVGNFSEQLASSASGAEATATPAATPQPTAVFAPDIVTLMVSPDDANTLVYLIYSGAKITLTLRNPNNTGPAVQTDAAMLEYLLTQYNIPVPAKLPYAVQPRLDNLLDPKLPGDLTPVP